MNHIIYTWYANHPLYNPCDRVMWPTGWEPQLLASWTNTWESLALLLRLRVFYQWGMKKNGATTVSNRKAKCFRTGISWVRLWWKSVQGQMGASWIVCPAVTVTLDQSFRQQMVRSSTGMNWGEKQREAGETSMVNCEKSSKQLKMNRALEVVTESKKA